LNFQNFLKINFSPEKFSRRKMAREGCVPENNIVANAPETNCAKQARKENQSGGLFRPPL
jgi:hypothetical protein